MLGICILPSAAQDFQKNTLLLSRGEWLFVGGSGVGNYTKIQDAIDNASDGDFVYVFSGIYPELIEIQKNITLLGENKNETIIDGQQKDSDIVTILESSVNVTDFSIMNNSLNRSCIFIQNASSCSVKGNNFHTIGGYAVQIYDSVFINLHENSFYDTPTDQPVPIIFLYNSSHCTVHHNSIENKKQTINPANDGAVVEFCKDIFISSNEISTIRHGIKVSGESIQISQNIVTDCFIGIAARIPENSVVIPKNITIIDNIVLRNSKSNIYLQGIKQGVISGNQVSNSPEYGIYIQDSYFSVPKQITVLENTVISNHCGIEIVAASQVLVEQNQIQYNDIGISIDYCNSSYTRNNTFLENNNSATFQWFWFFSSITKIRNKIPRFDHNFWDQKRTKPQPIIGRWHLWSPYMFPHVNFLFWITFDWHPADEPIHNGGA